MLEPRGFDNARQKEKWFDGLEYSSKMSIAAKELEQRVPEMLEKLTAHEAASMLGCFHNLYGAILSANSSLPLAHALLEGNTLTFRLDNISYHLCDEKFLREYLLDRLEELGVTEELVAQRNSVSTSGVCSPLKFSRSLLMHTKVAGTLTLAMPEVYASFRGTLNLESIAYRDFPEITPALLPKAVYKEGVMRVQDAGNISPIISDLSQPLPADLRVSVHAEDRHDSNWSLHCKGVQYS